GAAFCIYAQLLEKEDKKLSQENWRKCLKLAEGREINTEEEQWLYEARTYLYGNYESILNPFLRIQVDYRHFFQ
ncbi:MAG: hypothetical protein PX637_19145, partial [Microcystis sp. M53601_WE4]|nr:hypothetical protein [Microcystis sp. M53601_WE4]